MNNLNAVGHFMIYCNEHMGMDEYVTQERFQAGIKLILDLPDECFYECQSTADVLRVINWPYIL